MADVLKFDRNYLDFFVDPTDTPSRYDICDGKAYVILKKILTTGERMALENAGSDAIEVPQDLDIDTIAANPSVFVRINMGEMRIARVLAYLVEWNIPGPDGKSAPISKKTLKSLRPDVFTEIDKLVMDHEKAIKAKVVEGEGELVGPLVSAPLP